MSLRAWVLLCVRDNIFLLVGYLTFLSFSNMHAVTAVYIILLFATCSLWVSAVLPNLLLHITCIIVASSTEYYLQYYGQYDKVFGVP